ncbi:hypothetical protein COLO4_12480 [Corchorus olitorius]|uniref:Uncharacterized protein n=1 Tax=Corchorus olitorius TaxID=93759 RepID=A0A1R3K0R5_9ROSI|nr:hypothetical protein COLO4_12480 [Corchorus olitorius]
MGAKEERETRLGFPPCVAPGLRLTDDKCAMSDN